MENMRRRRINPTDDAVHYIINRKDKTGKLEVRYISSFKGRGLFASASFGKNDFVVEYRGELINCEESERRSKVYHPAVPVFMFDFLWHGKQWSIDAGIEDGSLGRLVNDNHISPNCKIKRMVVEGKPHLCIFAIKDISPGEEITYNYGDADWPWRNKMAEACTTPTEDVDLTICAQNTGQFSEQSDIPNTQTRTNSQIDAHSGSLELPLCLPTTPFCTSESVGMMEACTTFAVDVDFTICEHSTGQLSKQSDVPNSQINSSQIDIENGCEDLLLWLSSEPFSASGDVMVVDTSIPCTEDMELATCELITGQFSEQSDIPNTQTNSSQIDMENGCEDLLLWLSSEPFSASGDMMKKFRLMMMIERLKMSQRPKTERKKVDNFQIKRSPKRVYPQFLKDLHPRQSKTLTSVSSVPVGCKAVKRKKWDDSEVKAVEKHLGEFIQACALPGKVDCEGSLRAESHALKERDWLALKFHVKNRITTLKRRL